WFRSTAAHQTLTLDGRDSVNAPRHLLWRSLDRSDVVVFENASYPGLMHRRTVFFLDRQYFVLLDEALGSAQGAVDLHFQFAPGPFSLDRAAKSARTGFPAGANVLLWARKDAEVDLREERGQTSNILNRKEPRPAVVYRHRSPAPAVFLTLLIPHVGMRPPDVAAEWLRAFQPGQSRAALRIQIGTLRLRCGRDLGSGAAWVTRE
ncbi:MAG: heparinase II/III domain-containing protein, partial [Bryobacteraceae bacterium]